MICENCKKEFEKLFARGMCRNCYSKDYYKRNKEKVIQYRTKWLEDNPDKPYEYVKKWRKSSKGKKWLKEYRDSSDYKEYLANWKKENPDKAYEYIKNWRNTDSGKEYLKNIRNSDNYKEYLNNWKELNKELIKSYSRKNYNTEKRKKYLEEWWNKAKDDGKIQLYERQRRHQRRARIKKAKGRITKAIIQELIDSQFIDGKGVCPYCNSKITLKDCHLDHMEPLSKGGSNEKSNLIFCCAHCNLKKSDKSLKQWLKIISKENST